MLRIPTLHLKENSCNMKAIILLAGIITLCSCTPGKKMGGQQTSLYNTKWLLKKIHTDGSVQDVATKAFLRLDKEKGSGGGNGSCNSFGSNVTISDDVISLQNIFSTKMYCDDVQKTESAYFGQLAKANRFEVKDKRLLLYNNSSWLLEFEAE